VFGQAVLFQLGPHQRQGERRSVNGGVDVVQDVGQGADVVLVAVGEQDGPDAVVVFAQISDVGDDNIHAQQFGVRENHTTVDHHHVFTVLEDHHVHAELPQAS